MSQNALSSCSLLLTLACWKACAHKCASTTGASDEAADVCCDAYGEADDVSGEPDGEADFELLTKREVRLLLQRYDVVSGGAIPEAELPNLKQLSAILGRLKTDVGLSCDFVVMGTKEGACL